METYKIRLPNGNTIDRELEKSEVEYWLSIGMYLAHGFHLLTTVFAAEQMDEQATIPVADDDEEKAIN
ncbi:MAG TPA: hypothetical protein VGD26_02115 [Chitinophagaceae bacterium]